MDKQPARNFGDRVYSLVSEPGDTPERRIQKTLLLAVMPAFILASLVWGLLYISFDEPLAGAIPLLGGVIFLFAVVLFLVTRNFEFVRNLEMMVILTLPFLLMFALGGFINSSAVLIWSAIAPFSALFLTKPKQAPRWLALFLTLVVLGGLLQPLTRPSNNLPDAIIEPIFFVLNIGGVCSFAFLLLYYFVRDRNRALRLLTLEQRKSEALLLNVLPAKIARILKEEQTIAENFEAASVLFADVVGFTPLSAEMQPGEMVDLLNRVFSMFDALVEKYDLEKIRTIGDNYMVASWQSWPSRCNRRSLGCPTKAGKGLPSGLA